MILAYGIVGIAPGGDHYGSVLVGAETRRCYFDALRFDPTTQYNPLVGALVLVQSDRRYGWMAVQVIGAGAYAGA